MSGFGPGSGFVRAFLDSTGAVQKRDTIWDPPVDSLAIKTIERCTPQGCGSSTYVQPFGAIALRAFGPNGETALAVSSRYAVLWLDDRNHRIALLQQPDVEPALSDREKARAERTLDAIARNNGKSRASLPFGVPAHKAPLAALGFDLDGRLWVERSVPDGKPHEADVYDRRGRLAAIIQWPAELELDLWAIRGTTGIGVAVDSLGTNRVVRLRFR